MLMNNEAGTPLSDHVPDDEAQVPVVEHEKVIQVAAHFPGRDEARRQ